MTTSSHIALGRIGDAFGVHGWVHVFSFTDPADNLFQYKQWHIRAYQKRGATWRPIEIESYKVHSSAFIVKFKGCNDRDQALLLKNHTIAVERVELPAPKQDQYYWSDLVGLTVIDQHGKKLGVIDHLFEAGSNDVIAIKNKKPCYIPYLKDVVLSVDLEKKIMRVDWEILD